MIITGIVIRNGILNEYSNYKIMSEFNVERSWNLNKGELISWEKSAFFTDAEQSKFHVGIRRKNQ